MSRQESGPTGQTCSPQGRQLPRACAGVEEKEATRRDIDFEPSMGLRLRFS